MLSCLSCVRSVVYVLGGVVELEPREYNCGLRYLTVSCTRIMYDNHLHVVVRQCFSATRTCEHTYVLQ